MMGIRAAAATCAAALVIVSVPLGACRSKPAATRQSIESAHRPIVLVTIDTLRADRLGAYGSTRGLTPNLDRFAQSAVRFTAAVTQVPLTLPAHATILTGRHPAHHGIRTNEGFRLTADPPTLAEALRSHGHKTAAFIGAYPLQSATGLSRGFDLYDDAFLRSGRILERSADDVVAAAMSWIGQHRAEPFLAWLHLFDPHSPYTPPAPFSAAHADAPYDGEVAYTDAAIGRLLDRLQQLGLFSSATIVIVADHGESLGEHGERTHGTFLYDATVRVPLLIKLPTGVAPRTVDEPVEAADLAPTIAATAGTTMGGPVDGQNLLPLLRGAAGDPERPAYTESFYQNVLLGWSPLRAVRTRRWKFIEAPRPELYDLETDPGERENRIAVRAALASGLQKTLPAMTGDSAAPVPASAESAERLRSLGYVSGSTVATAATRGVDPKDRVDVWASIEDGIDHVSARPEAAFQAFSRALRLDPGNGLAMKYLADLHFNAGRLREADAGYRSAIAAGFRHSDTFVNLASIAERRGRLDEARSALAEAVRVSPSDADTWNRLGILDARRGATDAAGHAFRQAIAADPARAEPHYNVAIMERRLGDAAAAETHLRDALARRPDYPEALYELGTGYLASGRPGPALEAYRAALRARADYAEAWFGAARAARDLGQREEARRAYEQFLRIAPPEYRRQIAAAREALRSLDARHD